MACPHLGAYQHLLDYLPGQRLHQARCRLPQEDCRALALAERHSPHRQRLLLFLAEPCLPGHHHLQLQVLFRVDLACQVQVPALRQHLLHR